MRKGVAVLSVIALLLSFAGCSGGSGTRGTVSAPHECYVCGAAASEKVGSYWYCGSHAKMVRAFSGE